MSASDPFALQRFVDAQNACFDQVSSELRQGQKRSHWMWFIFPQLKGLGASPMAVRYAISGRKEAEAYLRHAILGSRLRQCAELVLQIEGRSIREIFGTPDDLKFRSSMTLFANATPENQVFEQALRKYFTGRPDDLTLDRLREKT